MKLKIELDEKELKELVLDFIGRQIVDASISLKDVKIEVKSKQNWKSEWEEAEFRAVLERG